MTRDILRQALGALERGEDFVMVTVIEVSGSAPASVGQKMLVQAEAGAGAPIPGRAVGTVGGGILERLAAEEAAQRLAGGESGLRAFDLDPGSDGGIGSTCGGRAVLAFEVFRSARRLLLFGAGHVALAFAGLCDLLGWSYAVADERADLLTPERYARATQRICDDPVAVAAGAATEGISHAVIFTHDHRIDRAILAALARRARPFAGYVGMIGSGRKWAEARAALAAEGIAPGWLDAVRCPVGLSIGSRAPAEIAVSIAAQIIQEQRKDQA
jgi:xanthine dehydrogenase accessory factor